MSYESETLVLVAKARNLSLIQHFDTSGYRTTTLTASFPASALLPDGRDGRDSRDPLPGNPSPQGKVFMY